MLNKIVAVFILLATARMLYLWLTGQDFVPAGASDGYRTGAAIGRWMMVGLAILALRELFWKKH